MSIKHNFKLGENSEFELHLNISGLDSDSEEIENLSAAIYAYNKDTYNPEFACSLSISELQNLYHQLDKYKFIKNSEAVKTGRFIEIADDAPEEVYMYLKDADEKSVNIAIKKILKDGKLYLENKYHVILYRQDVPAFCLMIWKILIMGAKKLYFF